MGLERGKKLQELNGYNDQGALGWIGRRWNIVTMSRTMFNQHIDES
jgi:hypothetical protein